MADSAVILCAAGKSTRFRDKNYKKPLAPLAGKAVWLHSAERFLNRRDVKQLILMIDPEDRSEFQTKFGANLAILGIELVDGGNERYLSVRNGLEAVRGEIEFVAVHDAARPCFVNEWIDRLFAVAEKTRAAIFATPVTGTLKRSRDGQTIDETVSRENLWQAQTPQVFDRQLLTDAYAKIGDLRPTDDAQVVENAGHPVAIVPGSPMNIKITSKEDLRLAEQILKALPKPKVSGPGNPFADGDMWR